MKRLHKIGMVLSLVAGLLTACNTNHEVSVNEKNGGEEMFMKID